MSDVAEKENIDSFKDYLNQIKNGRKLKTVF